jgi:hypothetical protein
MFTAGLPAKPVFVCPSLVAKLALSFAALACLPLSMQRGLRHGPDIDRLSLDAYSETLLSFHAAFIHQLNFFEEEWRYL